MADITWTLEADFNQDATFETDLTQYLEVDGIRVDRSAELDGAPLVTQLSVTLANRDGTFTPENSASALYGLLEPGVPVRIKALHNAITYVRWTGYIQAYEFGWELELPVCRITCEDITGYLGLFASLNVTLASRTTSAALVAIATAMGLTGADYNFATGQQTLPSHYVRNQDGLSAMMDAVRSEMGGALFADADGILQGLARNTRLGTTVAATLGDTTGSYPTSLQYRLSKDDLISRAQVEANIFANGQGEMEIFRFSRNAENTTPDSLALAPGQVYEFDADYYFPVTALTAPVAGTDYTANTLIGGGGTDRTSSLGVTVTDRGAGFSGKLVNNHASDTIYVTMFVLRGQVDQFASDRPRFEYSKPILNTPIQPGASISLPYADDSQATRDYAVQLVHTYRWPYPVLTATFDAFSDAEKVIFLGLELWDLVKYRDKDLGVAHANNLVAGAMVDDWWYVVGMRFDVPRETGELTFPIELTLVPSYLFRNLDRVVYDTFNRSNATGDLGKALSGDTWADDGNMDIASNAARANSDALQMPNLDLGAGATNQVIECDFAAIGVGDEVGVVFRYQDASNQYRCYFDNGTEELILEKNVAGVVTEIISPAFTVGSSHSCRVMMQGSRIRVWADRKLVIDTTDGALTTGTKVGLFARNANGTTTFEDIYGEGL